MSWKSKLITIARDEALQCNSATNKENSGEFIEKYLTDFREIFDKRENKNYFANSTETGFDWCAAFVFYCMNKSGYKLPLEPFDDKPTFAYVKTWFDYVEQKENWSWEEDVTKAKSGDLVIFRQTSSMSEFNHIGIVLDVNLKKRYLLVSEGNTNRRTQIMVRPFDFRIKGLIKISEQR